MGKMRYHSFIFHHAVSLDTVFNTFLPKFYNAQGLPMAVTEESSEVNAPPSKFQGKLLKPGAVTGQNNSRFVVLEDGHLKYYTSPDLTELKGNIDLRYYNVLPKDPSDSFSVSFSLYSTFEDLTYSKLIITLFITADEDLVRSYFWR